MADDGLRERLQTESKVLRDAAWSGPAATMLDASSKLSEMNALLGEILPELYGRPELGEKVFAALMNRNPDVLSMFDPRADDHPVVGKYFVELGEFDDYVCDSFDPKAGYWMTPLNPDEARMIRRRCVDEAGLARFLLEDSGETEDPAP
jgi:hypothetical protein